MKNVLRRLRFRFYFVSIARNFYVVINKYRNRRYQEFRCFQSIIIYFESIESIDIERDSFIVDRRLLSSTTQLSRLI